MESRIEKESPYNCDSSYSYKDFFTQPTKTEVDLLFQELNSDYFKIVASDKMKNVDNNNLTNVDDGYIDDCLLTKRNAQQIKVITLMSKDTNGVN